MSLYAIGDLHLCYQVPEKNMDDFGRAWKNHEKKLMKNCERMISGGDTLVLVGDHTWGKKLPQCEKDFEYIMSLPGRKILTRGNHDMFWEANKTERLNEQFGGRLSFLQNNYYAYEDYAIVGTKGYTFEGPFYLDDDGHLTGWDEDEAAHAEKLVAREYYRLRKSFEQASADGYKKFIMFLHYPPTNILQTKSCFTDIAEEYGVSQVIYAHCHGAARWHDSVTGVKNGVVYKLVSGDFLKWKPEKIL
ncbi:MAG: metallophosphoesterase [Anaerovoracaceae bacterium]|jgi:predicted phosphohydrolase